jgi:hypothetical protein
MEESTRKRPTRISMNDMVIIAQWVSSHKDILLQHSQTDLCRMIKKETNVECSAGQLVRFERAVGVTRIRGNAGGAHKDRPLIVARELVRFMKSLDFQPSQELLDICAAK